MPKERNRHTRKTKDLVVEDPPMRTINSPTRTRGSDLEDNSPLSGRRPSISTRSYSYLDDDDSDPPVLRGNRNVSRKLCQKQAPKSTWRRSLDSTVSGMMEESDTIEANAAIFEREMEIDFKGNIHKKGTGWTALWTWTLKVLQVLEFYRQR